MTSGGHGGQGGGTLFEYQGKCYLPSFSVKPPPSSLGP
jgi:hypothetical protein